MESKMTLTDGYQVNEISVSYKPAFKIADRPLINDSNSCAKLLRASWDPGKLQFIEEFKVAFFTRGNRLIGIFQVSSGGTCEIIVDLKVLFATALKVNAAKMIITHNHPSGSLNPSQPDLRLTQKIKEAGLLLGIALLDHIILTADSYYSFADQGLI
ncbi:JAB domain-containing protein [Chitinophaga sp. Ak27]|uniref:JAB domain-containing protein n=1 Tax=Chitinophaga sp. Ak27 TaxID=2726116 RepID=UPI00145E1B68|nr:JAB domain-containing protein [Chitinophaga sp. Ak27]NLU94889.1 DNA repair protein [Chitinophaga sp. Ak27]